MRRRSSRGVSEITTGLIGLADRFYPVAGETGGCEVVLLQQLVEDLEPGIWGVPKEQPRVLRHNTIAFSESAVDESNVVLCEDLVVVRSACCEICGIVSISLYVV
mgnify:CR=1 FL=1